MAMQASSKLSHALCALMSLSPYTNVHCMLIRLISQRLQHVLFQTSMQALLELLIHCVLQCVPSLMFMSVLMYSCIHVLPGLMYFCACAVYRRQRSDE